MKKSLQLKNGQMQIIGIMFLVLILIFSTTIFTKIKYFIQFGSGSVAKEQARHVAEAGIDKAIRSIGSDSSYIGETGLAVGTTGTANIIVQNKSPQLKTIIAEGFVPNTTSPKAKRKIQIDAKAQTASTVPLLNFGVAAHTAVINPVTSPSWVFTLGGELTTCAEMSVNVQSAQINVDGTLGTWNITLSLPEPRINHVSVAANSYIYVIAGRKGCLEQKKTVYFAQPAAGAIPLWLTTTPVPAGANAIEGAFYTNGRIYIIDDEKIYYTQQNADGTLDITWQTNLYQLPEPRIDAAVVFANDYLYIIGGAKKAEPNEGYNYDLYAPVDAGTGTVGPFSQIPSTFPVPHVNSTAVFVNNYLYVLGGRTRYINKQGVKSFRHTSLVYYSYVNPITKVPGPFSQNPYILPRNRAWPASVATLNKIYLLGGMDAPSGNGQRNTWIANANIGGDGKTDAWTNNGAAITYSNWQLDKQTYIAK